MFSIFTSEEAEYLPAPVLCDTNDEIVHGNCGTSTHTFPQPQTGASHRTCRWRSKVPTGNTTPTHTNT